MLKLTDRLHVIAEEINKGETMADIGTDHGFLPISLWERGICPKVIMADISRGSLKKAQDNGSRLYPDEKFDFRLGCGIEVLESSEVDVVVIAGMGGILMTEILEHDLEKSWSFRRFILQPRNNIGVLRHWLYNHSFSVSKEQLVREGRFICEILTVDPKEMAVTRGLGPERIEYEFPYKLLDFKGPLTKEYLERKLETEKKVRKGMEKAQNTDFTVIRGQDYRIEYLERLISQCHEEDKKL